MGDRLTAPAGRNRHPTAGQAHVGPFGTPVGGLPRSPWNRWIRDYRAGGFTAHCPLSSGAREGIAQFALPDRHSLHAGRAVHDSHRQRRFTEPTAQSDGVPGHLDPGDRRLGI